MNTMRGLQVASLLHFTVLQRGDCANLIIPSLFFLRFGSLSHPTNVRQPAATSVWERAGGEGGQRRLLGSVAPLIRRRGFSNSGGLGSRCGGQWSVARTNSTFGIRHLTFDI